MSAATSATVRKRTSARRSSAWAGPVISSHRSFRRRLRRGRQAGAPGGGARVSSVRYRDTCDQHVAFREIATKSQADTPRVARSPPKGDLLLAGEGLAEEGHVGRALGETAHQVAVPLVAVGHVDTHG